MFLWVSAQHCSLITTSVAHELLHIKYSNRLISSDDYSTRQMASFFLLCMQRKTTLIPNKKIILIQRTTIFICLFDFKYHSQNFCKSYKNKNTNTKERLYDHNELYTKWEMEAKPSKQPNCVFKLNYSFQLYNDNNLLFPRLISACVRQSQHKHICIIRTDNYIYDSTSSLEASQFYYNIQINWSWHCTAHVYVVLPFLWVCGCVFCFVLCLFVCLFFLGGVLNKQKQYCIANHRCLVKTETLTTAKVNYR